MRKQKNDISAFLNVRETSTRCKNKMLRSFGGTTLLDICLNKMHALSYMEVYYGAHEDKLLDKAKDYPFLNIVKRSYDSAHSDNEPSKIFEILHKMTTKWVLWINPCVPFLKMTTVNSAVGTFLSNENNSLTSVKKVQGWFYDLNGQPLTNYNIATQNSDCLFEAAHAFHIYERDFMIKNNKLWSNQQGDPLLFPIPLEESYDIDTEEEFVLYDNLYQIKTKK
jgi:CMP-N-acetylneuraminic acid synthetase